MPNIEKLTTAVTYIKDHPEKHVQGSWTCETGACLAGHVALQEGWSVTHTQWEQEDGSIHVGVMNGWMQKSGRSKDARAIAIEALEIDENTAQMLFHGSNTAENLELMAKDLANGEDLHEVWSHNGLQWVRDEQNA